MINCTYLHIPFCKSKCPYCAFCSYSTIRLKDEYIEALVKEIKHFYKNNLLKTIYFGGGTPSILDIKDLKKILECFNYDKNTSITIEANPLDLTKEKLQGYKEAGINRVSVGAQSFNNQILKIIGRNHTKEDIINAFRNLEDEGFDNYSIDLMYGLPNQTEKIWQDSIKQAIELDIKHISLYGLKIEEGTKYFKFPPENLPSLDKQADMYETAVKMLCNKYSHYEFSNFAKNINYYSIHNMAYWKRENYFGFGLSASGFIDNKRYTNTFNFKEYIKNPTKKEYKTLNKQQQIEEEIFLGLRLHQGINFEYINKKYNTDIKKKYYSVFNKFIKEGLIEKTNKGVKLTLRGILLSNEVLCEFIQI